MAPESIIIASIPWVFTTRPQTCTGPLGTRPPSRRWAVGKGEKLHLYLFTADPHHSHHRLSPASCQINSSVINVMCLNHPETIPIPNHGEIVFHKIDPCCQERWGRPLCSTLESWQAEVRKNEMARGLAIFKPPCQQLQSASGTICSESVREGCMTELVLKRNFYH